MDAPNAVFADGCSSCPILIRTWHTVPRCGSVLSIWTILLRMCKRYKPRHRDHDGQNDAAGTKLIHHVEYKYSDITSRRQIETIKEICLTAIRAISDSPNVGGYNVGFTAQPLLKRAVRGEEYNSLVLLADRLTRGEALQLEKSLWVAIRANAMTHTMKHWAAMVVPLASIRGLGL